MHTATPETISYHVDFSTDIASLYENSIRRRLENDLPLPPEYSREPLASLAITFLASYPYRHPHARASERLTVYPLPHLKLTQELLPDSDYTIPYLSRLSEQSRQTRLSTTEPISVPPQIMWGEWQLTYHDGVSTKFNSSQNCPTDKNLDRTMNFVGQVEDYIFSENFTQQPLPSQDNRNQTPEITYKFHQRMVPDMSLRNRSAAWLRQYAKTMMQEKVSADMHVTYLRNTGQSEQRVMAATDIIHSYWRSYDNAMRELE